MRGSARGDCLSLANRGTYMEEKEKEIKYLEAEQKLQIMSNSSHTNSEEDKGLTAQLELQQMDFGEEYRGLNKDPGSLTQSQVPTSEKERMVNQEDGVQDLENKAQEQHPQFQLRKMNGAQKKRLRWLVSNGHPIDEAQELALVPLSEEEKERQRQKRPKLDGPTLEPQPKKKKKKKKKGQKASEREGGATSFKDALEGVRVAVLDVNFPNILLDDDQMAMVKEAILHAVMEDTEIEFSPCFLDVNEKEGYMIVSCLDQATADWLKTKGPELKPWEGATLKVVSEGQIPRTQKLTVYFPNCRQDSTQRIMQFLQKQNKSLPVTEWKVVSRREEERVTVLTMDVDQITAARLEKGNINANFKFGQVQLRVKKRP